jgi:hypothetical protein
MEINDSVAEISWASKGWFTISDVPPGLELNGRGSSHGVDAPCMCQEIKIPFTVKLKPGKER